MFMYGSWLSALGLSSDVAYLAMQVMAVSLHMYFDFVHDVCTSSLLLLLATCTYCLLHLLMAAVSAV